jgi:hypothetical protein
MAITPQFPPVLVVCYVATAGSHLTSVTTAITTTHSCVVVAVVTLGQWDLHRCNNIAMVSYRPGTAKLAHLTTVKLATTITTPR